MAFNLPLQVRMPRCSDARNHDLEAFSPHQQNEHHGRQWSKGRNAQIHDYPQH